MPTNPPPRFRKDWNALRCARVSTSPEMLFQITASNLPSVAGVNAPPFSVTISCQPLRWAIAVSAVRAELTEGTSRKPLIFSNNSTRGARA